MLSAIVLATPIFGLVLTPPEAAPLSLDPAPIIALADQEGETTPPTTSSPEAELGPSATDETRAFAAALRLRQDLAGVHRVLGIATWAAMLGTVVLGFIQYYNLYGFFGGLADTPCVRGEAVFGQDQCWGEPWPHRVAAIGTTVLYTATFALGLAMPDPADLEHQQSAFAERVRIHKSLRWVHLAGMVLQAVLGLAIGQNWFGLHRSEDFGAMQALATIHQGIGLVTFGTLTAAGALMLF